jgi:hypothetical protein
MAGSTMGSRPSTALEIGVWRGTTAMLICESAQCKFTGIDIDLRHNVFHKHIDNSQAEFYQVNSQAWQLAQTSVDFIHIDGDHRESFFLHDITQAWHSISEHGIIVIDDYPTAKVWGQLVDTQSLFKTVAQELPMTVILAGGNQAFVTKSAQTKQHVQQCLAQLPEHIQKAFKIEYGSTVTYQETAPHLESVVAYQNISNTLI